MGNCAQRVLTGFRSALVSSNKEEIESYISSSRHAASQVTHFSAKEHGHLCLPAELWGNAHVTQGHTMPINFLQNIELANMTTAHCP